MHTHLAPTAGWSTASFGHAASTSPMELSALGAHLGLCQRMRGRLFTLQYLAEITHGATSTRFVTTLTALAAIAAVVAMVV